MSTEAAFNHKEGCAFKDFSKKLIAFDPNGPDSSLGIDENGIDYSENIHTVNKEDVTLSFNFCPCCGVARKE